MVIATSTLCNAHFPGLDLYLPAGVPTEVPDAHSAAVQEVPGVVVTPLEPTPNPED